MTALLDPPRPTPPSTPTRAQTPGPTPWPRGRHAPRRPAAGGGRSRGRHARPRDGVRIAAALVPVLLVALTAGLRLVNVAGNPQRVDDEGTYVAQAYALTHLGELAHYTYWYDHPPLGWMQLAAWSLLTGGLPHVDAVVAARFLMVVLAAVTAALLWVLAGRLGLSRWAAAGAVALFALSPLAVQFGRTVYLDNIALVWLLAALVCLSSPRQRLSAVFGGAACLGVAVLTKETMLLLVPAAAWLAWSRCAPTTRRYAMAILPAVFGLVVSTYVLAAAVRSELLPGPDHVSLVDGIGYQLWGRDGGGTITEAASDDRSTLIGWLALDPLLPALAAPAALAALLVRPLRPVALGVLTLCVVLLRPGYLPVPFVIALLPLTALLLAGVLDRAVRGPAGTVAASRVVPGVIATVLVAALAAQVWTPTLRYLVTADADEPLRQAQAWVRQHVPHADRIVVDDALWVDLVRDGRDRRDVVWFYKLDTDREVAGWSPNGWRDYDWVVSTEQTRIGAAATGGGQLGAVLAHGRPVAVFGEGPTRVEILRVTPDTAPAPAAHGAAALADRLADTVEPDAAAALRGGRVDPRLVATLAVLAATEDVLVGGLPALPGEDAAGRPRRQVELTATGARRDRAAAFFAAQAGAYAVEAVSPTPAGLLVRFPAGDTPVAVPEPGPAPSGGPARIRAVDLRAGATAGGRVELFAPAGRGAGALTTDGYGAPSGYRTVPAGTYLLADRATPQDPPVLRQVVTMDADRAYTLALFAGADPGTAAAQLVLDDAPALPADLGRVRLVEGAAQAGAVGLTVAAPGAEPVVLADGVTYGLVTGYAQVPAARLTATVTAGDRSSTAAVDVPAAGQVTLVVVDSPEGPAVRVVPDGGVAEAPLDAP